MNNLNFFTWIREGVKQAVLLGVSDAVERIGVPDMEGAKAGTFLDSVQENAAAIGVSATTTSSKSSSKRKRLGRSLKDVEEGGSD